MLTNPSYFASGNISPSRFVFVSNPFRVSQATANLKVVGVSQPGTRRAPGTAADDGYAAITDEGVHVQGLGTVGLLDIAGTIQAGQLIASDANGKGVVATSGQNVGAIALDNGVSGDLLRVFVDLRTAP